ncbi:ATP-binding protein [Pseudonocardia sp. TRM90224]|uniref:ATP-binding protein n=1 Tax=Pseudonocardia sp. TRM90224 TaxID=2812678 RepID=UPI001E3CDA20|nr:AAA family ATPase [Pseudonocardia sp. TRM90224]
MSDLVGRDHELGLLTAHLSAALGSGGSRAVVFSGEPGIGKTRLARAAVHRATALGAASVWGQCAEGMPYSCWEQVALACTAIVGEDGWSADLAVLTAQPGADPLPEDRAVVFDTTTRLVMAAAAAGGLVLVVEDLHHADRTSALLLRHVAQGLRRLGGRVLLIVTCRELEPDGLPGADVATDLGAEHIRLGGIDRPAIRALLAAAGGTDVTAAEVAWADRTTGGNPLLVSEVGRTLRGAAPSLVSRSAVADRLADLPSDLAELLRAAAVLGPDFHVGVLAQVVDEPALVCLAALDSAAGLGLVEATSLPGRYRFAHEAVRDGIEAGLAADQRVRLHRAAAQGIESFHSRWLEPHLSRLAHHWAQVAPVGDGAVAAGWAARAAAEAMRRLAFEEAARLYRLAFDVGSGQLTEPEAAVLLLGLAVALHKSGDLPASAAACQDVAAIARQLARPDLLAEAALVLESVGEPQINVVLRDLCREALDGLDHGDVALRARLLAQLTEAHVYLGETDPVEATSQEAMALAERSGDPVALIAAMRARHLAVRHPDGNAERLRLADRLEAVARAATRAEPTMWAELWRLAARLETGDLPAAAQVLPRLGRAVERVRTPLARWQLARSEATVAQALGRFDVALEHARAAFDLLTDIGHPGAQHQYFAVRSIVGHHVGPPPGLDAEITSFTGAFGPFADFRRLARALVLLDSGRSDAAAHEYYHFDPVRSWQPPWFLATVGLAMRMVVAVGIEQRSDVAALRDLLEAERGRHVTGRSGSAVYLGPVELYLGMAARLLGRDDAVADLAAAVTIADRAGARPHAVEARCELGAALLARAAPGDIDAAKVTLTETVEAARALGMTPFLERAQRLLDPLGGRGDTGLSARERQVAELVARGLSNRGIAESLVISERTAQNHVQHILTKLGFSSRTQIATWVAQRRE